MRTVSLFTGIGGMDLGLERAGFEIISQSEIDPYCCEWLEKQWPSIPNLGDITKIDWDTKEVEVVAGGFPCQDISVAGKQKGIEHGSRSGLWREFYRAIRVLSPKYAIVENVPNLSRRGLDIVLGDLAKAGFNAEWGCVPASSVGAPQRRERMFIVAYKNLAYTESVGVEGRRPIWLEIPPLQSGKEILGRYGARGRASHWKTEPSVGRLVERSAPGMGLHNWRELMKAIGNSVVPQVAHFIGEVVMDYEKKIKEGQSR